MDNYLQFNLRNWFTVCLMVFLMCGLAGMVTKAVAQYRGAAS